MYGLRMACVVTAQRYSGLATRKRSTDARDSVRPSDRNISVPLLVEITELLGKIFDAKVEPLVPSEDDEFLREVWQEVGGDLHQAMRDYPLSQAASDAESLPAPA